MVQFTADELLRIMNYHHNICNKPVIAHVDHDVYTGAPGEDLDKAPKFSRSGGEPVSGEDLDKAPKFSRSGGEPVSVSKHPRLKKRYQQSRFAVSQHPRLKKRYKRRAAHSPAKHSASSSSSLEMIAFGGKEIRKKKKASGKSFLSTFWDDPRLKKSYQRCIEKANPLTTVPPAHSPAKRSASSTSSLEMIAFGGKEIRKKKKASGKSLLSTFWDDPDDVHVAALKAHEALSVDDLSTLMAKSSSEVTSSREVMSHIQKLVQALGKSLVVYGKLLDLEKVATPESLVKSLSVENEMLKNKVATLTAEAENDKELVESLEKSLQVEKSFCKLKDKHIGELELKLQDVGARAVQDFKKSEEYSDELCKSYAEGVDVLMKWMAKHHPDLDLSGFAVDDVEKEPMSSEATAENVMEEATEVAEGMKEATIITLADPVPDKQ